MSKVVDKTARLVSWGVVTLIVLLLLATTGLLLFSCSQERRLTKDQWIQEMPPPKDINEAEALAFLENQVKITEQTIKDMGAINTIKLFSIIGIMASLVPIVLGTKQIKMAGFAGVVACSAGMLLVSANNTYPQWIALAGLTIALPAAGYTVFIIIRSMKEIIGNVQSIKELDITNGMGKAGNCSEVKNILNNQSDSTKGLVKEVKEQLVKEKE